MWKTLTLLFVTANIGWSHNAGDLLLVDEADRLLQIDNVQSLQKSLLDVKAKKAEKEQEVEALKAELENTKNAHAAQITEMKSSHAEELNRLRSTLQGRVDESWTLVDFMMEVMKKYHRAVKAMVSQLKEERECKKTIGGNLKMAVDFLEVILERLLKTNEDLKSVVSKESSIFAEFLSWDFMTFTWDVQRDVRDMVDQLKRECGYKKNTRENLKMLEDILEVNREQLKTIEDLKSVYSKESPLNAAYQQMIFRQKFTQLSIRLSHFVWGVNAKASCTWYVRPFLLRMVTSVTTDQGDHCYEDDHSDQGDQGNQVTTTITPPTTQTPNNQHTPTSTPG